MSGTLGSGAGSGAGNGGKGFAFQNLGDLDVGIGDIGAVC